MIKLVPILNRYKPRLIFFAALVVLLGISQSGWGQSQTFTTVGASSFTVPVGVTSIKVECWGGGGAGGQASTSSNGKGGGGGGAYGSGIVAVNAGNNYTLTVGAGGKAGTEGTAAPDALSTSGGQSRFNTSVIIALGGTFGNNATNSGTGGAGGLASGSTGTTKYSGGNGGNGNASAGNGGGGGGSSATAAGAGANGSNYNGTTGGAGGVGGDGDGGKGGNNNNSGLNGTAPGGGGGGRGDIGPLSGDGARGQVIISWITVTAISTETCLGGSTGTITATATGGQTPYTYSLNGGTYQSSGIFSGLAAATYTINAKDNLGRIAFTSVTVNAPAASLDVQATAGSNSWLGHVYEGINFNTYIGHYTEPLETIDQSFGGDLNCFSVTSNSIARSIYTETFSVRYRMNSNKDGLYVVDLGSDDGSRLTVDGTLLYNDWNEHAFTSHPKVLMNLNGFSSLVYEFYENGGQNRVVFQNLTLVLANTLSTNINQPICLGNTGSAISGDVYGALPLGISISGTGYQWTYSTTSSGTRTAISGATGATYTPNTSAAPFNAPGTYYIYRNAVLSSVNNVSPSTYIATNESNAATITVNALPVATFSYAGSPYCKGASNPSPTFSGGGVAGTFSSTSGLLFVSNATGQVNLATSTAGTYTVTNTIVAAGGCGVVTATSSITITALPFATISYTGTPFCKSLVGAQSVTRTGTAGGTYSALPAGLSIDASSGSITPSSSTAATYTVTYTMASSGGCGAVTATTSITINPNLPVSILIAPSANSVCLGTSITFTATPTNGGTTPVYQWKVNGANVGTSSSIYTYTPANNDAVTCALTSNASCATSSPATSNTVTMTVNANLPVSVSIVASSNPIFSGISVTFTASATNGGSTPTYQWKLNGSIVGSNSSTYANSSLVANDVVICVITSNASCTSGNPATSNSITMTVYPVIGNNVTDNINGAHGVLCTTAAENANAVLTAPAGTVFINVGFASYGMPNGTCPAFTLGGCHALTSQSTTEGYLLGNNTASIPATNAVFTDPCVGTVKKLYVLATYTEPICSGSTPGAIVGTLPTGGNGSFSYLWESSTTGSSSGFGSASGTNSLQNYTPGVLSQTTWYRRTVTSGGYNDISSVILIKVKPVIAGNTIGSVQTICTGSTPAALTGTLPTGGNGTYVYLWESSTTNATTGFTSASGTNNGQNYSPGSLTQTRWFRRTVTSGGCIDISTAIQITATPLPIATFSYAATPYCKNAANPSPTFSGGGVAGTFSSTAGLVFVSAATGQVNLSASTAGAYTVTNTIVAVGGCGIVTATSPITITTLPTATISYTGSPWCISAGNQNVTLVGTSGGTYSAPAGLTINSGTGAITPSSSTAGTYTVTYTIPASGGCVAVPATTSVTITTLPVATFSYSGTPYCKNAANPSPTFSGGGVAGAFSSTAGLVFVSTSTGQINLVTSTAGTYTVTNTIAAAGGCAEVVATSVITITALPTITGTSPGSRYESGTVTLSATVSAGTINWYASSTGVVSLGTGQTFTTPIISSSTTYYVDVTNNGCTSATRTPVLASIITPASISAGGGGSFCTGSSVTLTSSGTNIINRYWTGPNSFYSLEQNPVLTNVTSALTGTYTVTGSSLSEINLVYNGDFTLGNIGFTNNYNLAPETSDGLQPEGTYAIIAIPQSRHASFATCTGHMPGSELQMVVNGATTPDKNIWAQTVNNIVPNTNYQFTYWVQSVVGNNPSELQLFANDAVAGPVYTALTPICQWKQFIYNWNSGTSTTVNLALKNKNTVAGGNDFALDGIELKQVSSATASVIVTVDPISVGGSVTGGTTICSGTSPTTDLTLIGNTGSVVKWQKSSDATFTSPTDIAGTSTTLLGITIGNLTATNYFRAVIQSGSCSSAFSSATTVTVNPLPIGGTVLGGTTICSGSNSETLTLSGYTGTITRWESSVSPFSIWTDIVNTSTSYTSGALTQTTQFRAVVERGSCGTANSVVTTVTITPLPVATFRYTLTPSPIFSGGGVAGIFSSTTGLNFVSTATGEVNLASTPGTYIVTNTVIAAGGCGTAIATGSITISTSHSVAYVWVGVQSTDWNVPDNWSTGVVPVMTSDAVIPDANTTNFDPVLPSDSPASASVKTISLQGGGILNGGTATIMTVAGSASAWQNLGTFNAETSTVSFTNANTTIVGSTDFFNVSIADEAFLTLETDYIMGIAGALSLSSTGKLDATSNHNTVIYNGTGVTGNQTIINPNGTIPGYYNLILNGSGIKSISATAKLTVLGTLANNVGASGFVLQSNASGTASLIHNTDAVPATVERYIGGPKEKWHFLSSPVKAQDISGNWLPAGTYANGTGYDLYLWNEPTNCWIYKLDVATDTSSTNIKWINVHKVSNFIPGRGYLYSLLDSNQTKTFVGSLNNGLISDTLTIKGDKVDTLVGFNLVGNPYPSSIDWGNIPIVSGDSPGWTRSNLVNSGGGYDMWILNIEKKNYGVYNSFTGLGTLNFTRYIAPMQGFFVRAASAGVMTMDNRIRVHEGAGGWKSAKINPEMLSVVVESETDNSSDEALLLFGYNTDQTGASKLFSPVLTAPSLFIPFGGKNYTVRYLTNTKDNPMVPVMFKPGKDGNYTFNCSFEQSNFETVMLEDRQMHYIQNMKVTKTYSFKAAKKDKANRFVLYFGPINGSTGFELPARIYTDGTRLIVDLTLISKETSVFVYDIMGRILLQQKLQGEILHNLTINAQTQTLVVYLQNPDGRLSRKIIWVR